MQTGKESELETEDRMSSVIPAESGNSRLRLILQIAAVIAAYCFIVFVLCPDTLFIGTPVHHDDFNNLSYTEYSSYELRPVSYAILMTLSLLGIPVYYTSLHI